MQCHICFDILNDPTFYCKCKTLFYHDECLIKWIKTSKNERCKVCKETYPKNLLDFSLDDVLDDSLSLEEFNMWLDPQILFLNILYNIKETFIHALMFCINILLIVFTSTSLFILFYIIFTNIPYNIMENFSFEMFSLQNILKRTLLKDILI
jgi:hypothetical protein